jgi:hypothetical protein
MRMDCMTLYCASPEGSGPTLEYLDMGLLFLMEYIFHPKALPGTIAMWSLKVGSTACAFILVDDTRSMDIFGIAYPYQWNEFCL